ncbi:MAG: TIGR02646 family protein [Thiomargarita sp.]|nr:TIGR02646 family protein [Thiomargarita sp.]
MIRIRKPVQVPERLLQQGQKETKLNKRCFENGTKIFEIKNDIYGHKSVKNVLKKAQHQKCCFCERKEEVGDIEHFRPKGHYYWLAYEWDNLFFCCPTCNRSYKNKYFPLVDESQKAQSHLDDINKEKPLFIHPEKDDPEKYIEYIGSKPHAINNNEKGKVTIQKIGLNRKFFSEERTKYYKICKSFYETIEIFSNLLKNENNLPAETQKIKNQLITLKNQLESAQKDNAEYASMIRCAIKDKFRF